MKKIALGLSLAAVLTSSAFAMEVMGTGTMMKKDDVMMKKDDAMMMKDKMVDGKMMDKMDDKMMMSDEMIMKITNKSKREDVSKLQMFLVEKGYLKMPRGVAFGYYGKLTTKAFMNYKESKMMKKDDVMMKKDDAMMMKDKMEDKMMRATDTMIKTN